MPQEVLKLSFKTIEAMKQYYHKSLTAVPQGAIFRAKTENAVITAYKSGKVLFQGSSPQTEVMQWTSDLPTEGKQSPTKKTHTIFSPPETLFTGSHIGSDEAGTGDYFGPITVAAAFVRNDQISLLKDLGVKDSKNLTDDTILELSKEIVKHKIPYSLLILHNPKYNSLQEKGWTQGKMKAMLHHHAISKLNQKIDAQQIDGILIDQFCEPTIYKKHIGTENQQLHENTYFMTKAESYSIAVATASIIARASFVKQIDKLSDELGIPLKKGASKLVDQTIAKVITDQGEETLRHCAKIHFANTKKAKAYL